MESNALASAYETDELPLLYPAIKLCLVSLSLIFEWGQHPLMYCWCLCPSYLNGDNTAYLAHGYDG